MAYVYSTCTSGNIFPMWIKTPSGDSIYEKHVEIKGGANVADPRTIITEKGVATQVSDEELAYLKANPSFMGFVERGFMSFSEGSKNEGDKAYKDMEAADNSAPITPAEARNGSKRLGKGIVEKEANFG